MQRFSKDELQEQADKFMAAHSIGSFLATEDGNFFHPKDKNLAHDHNNKNVKGEVIEFKPPTPEPPTPEGEKEITHIITQADLDNNEGLADVVSVGDEVGISESGNFQPLSTVKEITIDPADATPEIITPAPISEDVDRHGEPVPVPKAKAEAKPKAKAKAKAKAKS